ncbi:MAG: hypothetical protein A2W99_15895 [Bacteroidetes bacterium GWF2_33_16]|nr:MAG: hypothetical protein A2X00_15240 [Bacteroidetes bacterium GWE2_32_14]OFY02386.1 MAG: hypothetical protein A2W99_15895 [Bacteroidetes bacterium GWF2_33_16]
MYTISVISNLLNAKLIGNDSGSIEHLLIDSRNAVSSPNTLFFAIRGERHDGHKFINELYEKGIRNFVVEQLPEYHKNYTEASFLVVSSAIIALHQLAAYHRKQFNYPVIGITGSNGKTIVKEWLYHVLQTQKNIVRSPKSFNSQVGVPLSVWLMNKSYDLAIFEAGISLPGEMEKLEEIIKPTIGLITNIGESHQENFDDYKQKAVEKLSLFKNSETIVYCRDHLLIHELIQNDHEFAKKKCFTWSTKSEADLIVHSSIKNHQHTTLQIEYSKNKVEIIIPFTDSASIEDATHVIALLCALGYNLFDFKNQLESIPPVAMRLELKNGINRCTLINDSYNSDLNSLNIALHYLDQQNQHSKKILILSDILQSGKDHKQLYTEVSQLISKYNIYEIIGIGPGIASQKDIFTIEKSFFSSTIEFLEKLPPNRFSDSAILLKGSRAFEFEKISSVLEEKVHRTILEINLNALISNLNYFKSKLNPGTKIMVMVKALSYGSGTHEIANILQYQGVDYLGVAFADEGVALREAGIKLPIIVMNPELNSFDIMVRHKLEPEIYSFLVLKQFIDTVRVLGTKDYPIHIKIDSGMHRLGFMSNEIDVLINELMINKNVKVASIFSHLAASDEDVHDSFTEQQISTFDKLSTKISNKLNYSIIRHILNSAGIERFPQGQFDMVRLGIGLYGISALYGNQLANVSTLKSTVIQIKQVAKGETIGYNRKGIATDEITVAIIPVGYADGLNRHLSNGKGKLFIKGHIVPIIGNICMDMCMADITGCDINEGDEVIVFGKEISVTNMANTLQTIPYEIFTGISTRVKRVYFHE